MAPRNRRSSGRMRKLAKPCTFDLGYVRQDLYGCRKCTKAAGVRFGFCGGCRESCHADHLDQVFELYTKRSFRCDCGNHRAKNVCLLNADKDDVNIGNEKTYNHNFDSRYCRCDREYNPSEPMAQCAICEDWFHETCYKLDSKRRSRLTPPFMFEYELICRDCVAKLPLLAEYYDTLHAWASATDIRKWRSTPSVQVCTRPKQVHVREKPGTVELLWKPGFRVYLCRCPDCSTIYRDAGVSFIVDRTDFVGVVSEDDTGVFNDTPDEDIIASDDEDIVKVEIIRRKGDNSVQNRARARLLSPSQYQPASNTKSPDTDGFQLSTRLDKSTVDDVRNRILSFLHKTLGNGDRQANQQDVLRYVSDLKTDLLATFSNRLDEAISKQ